MTLNIQINPKSEMAWITWSGQTHLDHVARFFLQSKEKIGEGEKFSDMFYIHSELGSETRFVSPNQIKNMRIFDTAKFILADEYLGKEKYINEHLIVRIDLDGLRRPLPVSDAGNIVVRHKHLSLISPFLADMIRQSPEGKYSTKKELVRQIRETSRGVLTSDDIFEILP